MHFWQAFKMAFKSLKTNKLRSFLTMLGIIIGVVSVSLLSSVAQGVSEAVVSSIRSQSTLAVFINMNKNFKTFEADNILKASQPKKDAEDYYEYSLLYTKSTKVANQSFESISESSKNITEFLTPKKTYTEADFPNYDSLSESEKGLVELLKAQKGYYGTSIIAVDQNFNNVFTLEYDGEYMKNSNEIMVDSKFIKTYLGESATKENSIGKLVTLGIDVYTQIVIGFQSLESLNSKKQILIDYINENSYSSISKFSQDNKSIIVDEENLLINIKSDLLNDSFKTKFKVGLYALLEDTSIDIDISDIIDSNNAKTYKIVAVISDETVSLLSSIQSSLNVTDNASSNENSENDSVLLTYMSSLSSKRGTCYMIYNDENAKLFNQKDVQSSNISYAYLRYKTEKVMEASTTKLIISFSSEGYTYLSDFMLVSFSSVANIISNIMNILTIMLTVISIISLIVGGIGIMNIMLVAVTERTKEIGIRKAIGAKKSSILVQFLIEALTLSLIGGAIGLGISAIGIVIISHFMEISIILPLWVVALSIGFCTTIGLLFGLFPAIKASNMQPIDALRRD